MRPTFQVLLTCMVLLALPAPAAAGGFRDWTPPDEKAALVLLLTGGDAGFVRPKGCFKGTGGSLYRPGLNAWLRGSHAAPRLWLSTGDVLTPLDEEGMAAPEQVLDNLSRSGYSGVGVGGGEFDVIGVPPAHGGAGSSRNIPWIGTNLVVFESGAGPLARSRIVKAGGLEIGVLAVSPHRPGMTLGDLERGTLVTVDPVAAVRREMKDWKSRPDYVVLLAPLPQAEARRVARELSGIDLVLASSALLARPEPEVVGETPVLWVGGWGRFLGRVQLDAESRVIAAEVIEVGSRFPIDPTTGEPRSRTRPAVKGGS